MKRYLIAASIAATLLLVSLAVTVAPLLFSSAATHATSVQQSQMQNTMTTINALARISTVGSTQFIVDPNGHTANVDANPYDIQIVPSTPKTLPTAPFGWAHAGDLVATNIGNADKGNTLVLFPARVGPGHQFNSANSAFSGLAKEAFNTETGTDWVTNFSKNTVVIFNPNGSYLTTISNALFQKPWGISFNGGQANPAAKSTGSFFVSNATDATIDRIDIVPINGVATFQITQIAQLPKNGDETKIALTWAPTLKINQKDYSDVLLALDPAQNRVAAFPNSTTTKQFTDQGLTAFQGKPLNNPGGIALNPLNNDLLVVNLNDNNLLELNPDTNTVVGMRLLDTVPVDLQTGNGSALFGVTAGKDRDGNLVVYFTDDNTNTVDLLSA